MKKIKSKAEISVDVGGVAPVYVDIPGSLAVTGDPGASPVVEFELTSSTTPVRCTYANSEGSGWKRSSCDVTIPADSFVEIRSLAVDPQSAAKVSGNFRVHGSARPSRPDNRDELLEAWRNRATAVPLEGPEHVPDPNAMTLEFRAQARDAARKSPIASSLLGSRNAFTALNTVDPPKEAAKGAPAADRRQLQLTFWSYTNSRAVFVQMEELEVKSAAYSDAWPGSGKEEQDRAEELARLDARLPAMAKTWDAGSMLASFAPDKNPAPGHRVIDVRFSPVGHRVPSVALYYALVDVTDEKVLELAKVQ